MAEQPMSPSFNMNLKLVPLRNTRVTADPAVYRFMHHVKRHRESGGSVPYPINDNNVNPDFDPSQRWTAPPNTQTMPPYDQDPGPSASPYDQQPIAKIAAINRGDQRAFPGSNPNPSVMHYRDRFREKPNTNPRVISPHDRYPSAAINRGDQRRFTDSNTNPPPPPPPKTLQPPKSFFQRMFGGEDENSQEPQPPISDINDDQRAFPGSNPNPSAISPHDRYPSAAINRGDQPTLTEYDTNPPPPRPKHQKVSVQKRGKRRPEQRIAPPKTLQPDEYGNEIDQNDDDYYGGGIGEIEVNVRNERYYDEEEDEEPGEFEDFEDDDHGEFEDFEDDDHGEFEDDGDPTKNKKMMRMEAEKDDGTDSKGEPNYLMIGLCCCVIISLVAAVFALFASYFLIPESDLDADIGDEEDEMTSTKNDGNDGRGDRETQPFQRADIREAEGEEPKDEGRGDREHDVLQRARRIMETIMDSRIVVSSSHSNHAICWYNVCVLFVNLIALLVLQ